jgi:hemoglobin
MTSPTAPESSLYARLGGYDAICAATDDLLGRLQSDSELRDYWKGTSEATRRKGRQLVVDFMVEAAGGPAYYAGHDMRTAHAGMHIAEHDWEVFMRHAAATLEHFAVPARERDEVLGFFTSLKDEVVELQS